MKRELKSWLKQKSKRLKTKLINQSRKKRKNKKIRKSIWKLKAMHEAEKDKTLINKFDAV